MLTVAQFDVACQALIAQYSVPVAETPATAGLKGWSWKGNFSLPGPGFMSRTTTHFWRSKASAVDCMPAPDAMGELLSEEEEDEDVACMVDGLDTREELVAQQYVVYSATFQVPTFYFTVHDSNGTPLPLSKLVRTSLFHPFALERTEMNSFGLTRMQSSFPLLSQGEHPVLGTPCWYLHPCETGNSVDELMAQCDNAEEATMTRWLEMWFMVVGSVVKV